MPTAISERAITTKPAVTVKPSAKKSPKPAAKSITVTLRRLARDFDGGKAKKGTIALILDPTKWGTGPEGWLNRVTYADKAAAIAAAAKAGAKVLNP